jgi:hypothetical protein
VTRFKRYRSHSIMMIGLALSALMLLSCAVLPRQRAMWYAWNAITGGSGLLIACWFLHASEVLNAQVLAIPGAQEHVTAA